jgi:hypothetical protein
MQIGKYFENNKKRLETKTAGYDPAVYCLIYRFISFLFSFR